MLSNSRSQYIVCFQLVVSVITAAGLLIVLSADYVEAEHSPGWRQTCLGGNFSSSHIFIGPRYTIYIPVWCAPVLAGFLLHCSFCVVSGLLVQSMGLEMKWFPI